VVLDRSFYDRDPVDVARDLIGKRLVRATSEGIAAGRIVEVEAYLSAGDPACHAARGRTRKNRSMFGPPGRAYVYCIHARWCFNAVTEPRGTPSAVLVRAVEPLEGLELMSRRRRRVKCLDFARGPGRLCEALAIARSLDGWDLTRRSRLWIDDQIDSPKGGLPIAVSGRIGISLAADLPLRFYVPDSPFVSRGPRGSLGRSPLPTGPAWSAVTS
jgi:DNA-3-methyladenine glycosylase